MGEFAEAADYYVVWWLDALMLLNIVWVHWNLCVKVD